jgi:hypothetical protein
LIAHTASVVPTWHVVPSQQPWQHAPAWQMPAPPSPAVQNVPSEHVAASVPESCVPLSATVPESIPLSTVTPLSVPLSGVLLSTVPLSTTPDSVPIPESVPVSGGSPASVLASLPGIPVSDWLDDSAPPSKTGLATSFEASGPPSTSGMSAEVNAPPQALTRTLRTTATRLMDRLLVTPS